MKFFLCLTLVLFVNSGSFSQALRTSDFNTWYWFQLTKNVSKKSYVSLQYETRYFQNSTQFYRSDFYFLGGKNITKNLNAELLYQFNTDKYIDEHVFYAGLSYKFKVKNLTFIYRNAFQQTRNHFTGNYLCDQPINQWRMRLRIQRRVNNYLKIAVSSEPTINILDRTSNYNPPVFVSKLRNVALLSFDYNKYNSIHLFYFYQFDYHLTKPTSVNHVLGISYALNLPQKMKKLKKIFKSNISNDKDDKGGDKRKENELF